jgi:hypothetical protein
MLRYAFFQASINENFKMLESTPQSVQESVKFYVTALLHIDCFDDAEAQASPNAAFHMNGHDDCGFHSFKEAIYQTYEYEEQKNASLYDLKFAQVHFARYDGSGVISLNNDAIFGTLLHPSYGLFIEADMPSDRQMARHAKLAKRRKAIKVIKQEPDTEIPSTDMPQDRRREDRMGLFVDQIENHAHESTENDMSLGYTVSADHVVEYLADRELPDDTDYDSDIYDLDAEWELDSNCSTEPDDEFFEDINEIEVYRQLRGVDKAMPPVEKRKRTLEVDLTADGGGGPDEEASKKKRKKSSKDEKKARKEERKHSKEEKQKMK